MRPEKEVIMTQIPSMKGLPFLGVVNQFQADRIGFMMRAAREHGDIVGYRFAIYQAYQLNHPALIHQVLVAQADKFIKSVLDHQVMGRVLGEGLLTSEGEKHATQRRLMQPAFHHRRIAAYADVMVTLTARTIDAWRDGQRIDMHAAMTDLTREIVLETLFGSSEDMRDVAEAIETFNHIGGMQFARGFVPPRWLPLAENRALDAVVRRLDGALIGLIEARRKSREDHGDLLSMLLLAQDETRGGGMTDREVRDEVVTLFAAGHETTANALAWTCYLLAQNPEAEARLQAEVDSVLAGRAPTLADLPNLPYTEQVIREALRLYPPAWVLNGRAAQQDVQIEGYHIPRGAVCYISPYVMHHQASSFPEPERFRPERWVNDFEKSLPRYTYFPFGGGPRICIGNSFAMMEARLVLAMLASAGSYALQPGARIEMDPLITLRPKHGVPVTVKLRQPALSLQPA
jgi:cytochrome P450